MRTTIQIPPGGLLERINHSMFFGKYKDRLYWECQCPHEWTGFAGNWRIDHEPHCVATEELRRAEIAEWRGRAHRIAVFKAIVASGLLFLICGSAALIAYALEW